MKQIQLDINKYKVVEKLVKPPSRRSEIIGEFTDTLNEEREGTKYRQLTYRGIACKLGHVKKLHDLEVFLASCKQANNFSAYFFWALK